MSVSKIFTKKTCVTIFIVLLMFYLIIQHLYGYFGHYGYDDMDYARLAVQMLGENFELEKEHFAYRWGLLVPLSWAYACFGINDTASALPAWAATFGTLLLLISVVWRKKIQVIILAMSLYLLNQWTVFYADKMMPDVWVCFAFFAAIATLYHFRYSSQNTESQFLRNILYAFAFVLTLFLGFVSKGTILLTLPVFLFVFLSDVIQRKHLSFWLMSFFWGGLILAAYFFYIYIETGHPLMRFIAIQSNSYFNACSYDQLPFAALWKRISYELVFVFISEGLVSLLFLIPALLCHSVRQLLKMNDEAAFLTTTATIAFLAACYMSISPTSYLPMCPDIRHFLYLSPIAAVAVAPIVERFLMQKQQKKLILLLIFIIIVIAYYNRFELRFWFYTPIISLFLLRFILPLFKNEYKNNVFVAFFIMLLFIPSLKAMHFARQQNYSTQKAVIQRFFNPTLYKNNTKQTIVITNTVQRNLADYYLEFNNEKIIFLNYKQAQKYPFANTDSMAIYLLTNGFTRYLSGLQWRQLPNYVQQIPDDFSKIYEEKNVSLYKVEKMDVLGKN